VSIFDSFCAFDCETSGFLPRGRILELGLVVFENGRSVYEWSQLFCPEGVDWTSDDVKSALAVNHITREMLEGKPTFNQVVPDLLLEFEHDLWVAHNASFDLGMLNSEFLRYGRQAPAPALSCCTMQLSSYLNNVQGHKLAQVAERYGVKPDGAHRAVADAAACGAVFHEMTKSGKLPDSLAEMQELTRKADHAWKTRSRGRRPGDHS